MARMMASAVAAAWSFRGDEYMSSLLVGSR
jgi:hypothetical protein